MTVVILGEAERELAESVAYYERRRPASDGDPEPRPSSRSIKSSAILICTGCAQKDRRRNLHAFPHYIVYLIREATIWIVAIAQAHRLPEFWLDRI